MHNKASICLAACMTLLASPALAGQSRWEGFYAGGSIGSAAGDTKGRTSVAPGGTYFNYTQDAPQVADEGSQRIGQWKWSGGLFGGYNHQFGNMLIGVEASANSLFLDDTKSGSAIYDSDPNIHFSVSQRMKANWQETLRLRVGYVQDNWLAYATGGAALSQVTYAPFYNDDNAQPGLGYPGSYGRGKTSKTLLGMVLGLGGEYALSDNWSLKGEYLFTDYNNVKTSYELIPTPTLSAFGATFDNRANLRTHSILIGVAYRFNLL